MAQQTVDNLDTGLSARNKINENFTELYTNTSTALQPADLQAHNTSIIAHDDIRQLIASNTAKIAKLESMGDFIGVFDTFAEVPIDVSGFIAASVNDFVIVRVDENQNDEPTMYMISAINGTTIVWEYILTFATDITGMLPLSGGTMLGTLIAQSNINYSVAQVCNIIISDIDLQVGVSALPNGMVYLVYEPAV